MGCLQSSFHGICNYYDDEDPDIENYCMDKNGYCSCEEDPDPACQGFENDSEEEEEDEL